MRSPELPPIPRVVGKLDVRIVYPPEGSTVVARDSSFLYGSVGTSDARLIINGVDVPVLPNGSFLAWVALPPRERPVFDLVAVRGADTARVSHRIARPPLPPLLADSGRLQVDTASLTPRGVQLRLANDIVRVSVRAPRNAEVNLIAADGRRLALARHPELGGGDSTRWTTDVDARTLAQPARVFVSRGRDTVAVAAPRVGLIDSLGTRYGVVGAGSSTLPDTDRVVIARPVVGGTYKWFLLPGTVVELSGRSGDSWRVRLDPALDVWIDAGDVRELPAATAAPVRLAANARVVARSPEASDVVIPIGERPAFSVREHDRSLELTLFGTTANTDIINIDSADSIVRHVTWEQETNDRAHYTVELNFPVYGYLAMWERGAFVLRLRRPPLVDKTHPLAGLTIAVDAGHPPAGSTGPTGLYEAVATLAVASRLRTILEQRGAKVVMTRDAPGAVALGERPVIARRAGAHAFVSIHLNALPDGVNPFNAHGTGTYYFNARSEPLARATQRGMVRRMGLRDLGINYDNLAVLRPTWMPSILCEGAFIMIPAQEAALRKPEFQEAYALGVADGIESYFRGLVR